MAIKNIIIQAGGKGTRLEGLTRNKPKCLVPVNNLPIIFYAFKKFKDAHFTIIADYKTDVLEKYLNAFAAGIDYRIVKAYKKGTASGIKEAVSGLGEDEPFMILWCDLILSDIFGIPETKGNYIGISKDFECRTTGLLGYLFLKTKSYSKIFRMKGRLCRGCRLRILSSTG